MALSRPRRITARPYETFQKANKEAAQDTTEAYTDYRETIVDVHKDIADAVREVQRRPGRVARDR